MIRKLHVCLLASYMLFSTQMLELAKVPVLFEHFNEHQIHNQDITIWEFILIHYTGPVVKDADYEQDMKLPFKTSSLPAVSLIYCVPIPYLVMPLLTYVFFQKEQDVHYSFSYLFHFLSFIWNPPRF